MNKKSNFLITNEKRVAFLRDSTKARQRQSDLVPQSHAQNIAWAIIYVVTEAFLSGRKIYVTDVCHAVESSKSTTIKGIDHLVGDKIIERRPDKIDRRRKLLTISRTFKPKILSYIDETIALLGRSDIIRKIEDDTRLSLIQMELLLSSLKDFPIPIMIHAEDGEILMISKEWERLTGYKHEEIPTIEIWTDKAYSKNDTVNEVRGLIAGLYKIEEENDDGIGPVHTKNGETRMWRFRSSPLGKLPDGRANIISIATDIT